MKLKSFFFVVILSINFSFIHSQITDFKSIFELPEQVKETSGMLFYEGKIITHNDSGDSAKLYEIDSNSGNLTRTIQINNATNIDWEDLAEDQNHIYIGDFGNNNGNRKDLKIYRILKSDFKNSNAISAEEITFFYEDQNNFNSSSNHNFDAEAFVIYENSILIFTKNRGNFKTNVYKIPLTIGNHKATFVSFADVEGLITGATLVNNNFILCGYNSAAIPFIIYISSNRNTGDDIFNSGFEKHILYNEIEQGSQVEAITSFDEGKFYLTRESVNNSFVNLSPKLFEFKDDRTKVLSNEKNNLTDLKIFPNPSSRKLNIQSKEKINSIIIYNILRKNILTINKHQEEIDISNFSKGIYFLKIQFPGKKTLIKKFIKL